ncbi:11597_t:CDS:2 [Racocetra fulgida]|uniref:11597_t:CDS:1 n=1 Tax=Racocetra fulgida TaxID=60492 RepID=A0A9N8ZB97_9GLOM|nr:11597_t:CDS:2 [Racocetra fulgida]
MREKYGNIWLLSRYQVNNEDEPESNTSFILLQTSADDDLLLMSDLHEKYSQLEVISKEVEYLREENKFLATVNSEFNNKNNTLTKENKELISKFERFQKYQLPDNNLDGVSIDNEKELSTEDSLESSYKEQDNSSYDTDIERNLEEQEHDVAILTNKETSEEGTPNCETL